MATYIPKGMFNFSITSSTLLSSYKINTTNGSVMVAQVKGRLFRVLFPKQIDIRDDATKKLVATIEINNFLGTRATINRICDDVTTPVGEISVCMKGIIGFFIGKLLVIHTKDNEFIGEFASPSLVQQIQDFSPYQTTIFPVKCNHKIRGNLEVIQYLAGGYSCSFQAYKQTIKEDHELGGLMVLSGTLLLLRKLISCSGP